MGAQDLFGELSDAMSFHFQTWMLSPGVLSTGDLSHEHSRGLSKVGC